MSKPLVQVTVAGFEPRRPGFQVNALHPTLCCSPVGDSGRSVSEELKGFWRKKEGAGRVLRGCCSKQVEPTCGGLRDRRKAGVVRAGHVEERARSDLWELCCQKCCVCTLSPSEAPADQAPYASRTLVL